MIAEDKKRKEFRKGDDVFTFANGDGIIMAVHSVDRTKPKGSIEVQFKSKSDVFYYNQDGTRGTSKHQVLFHGRREDALELLKSLQPAIMEYWLVVVRAAGGSHSIKKFSSDDDAHSRAAALVRRGHTVLEVMGPYSDDR